MLSEVRDWKTVPNPANFGVNGLDLCVFDLVMPFFQCFLCEKKNEQAQDSKVQPRARCLGWTFAKVNRVWIKEKDACIFRWCSSTSWIGVTLTPLLSMHRTTASLKILVVFQNRVVMQVPNTVVPRSRMKLLPPVLPARRFFFFFKFVSSPSNGTTMSVGDALVLAMDIAIKYGLAWTASCSSSQICTSSHWDFCHCYCEKKKSFSAVKSILSAKRWVKIMLLVFL